MYKLVLYGLRVLFAVCLLYSFLGILSYTPLQLFISITILICTCIGSNWLFAKLLNAPTNIESANITSLILFFIFVPASNTNDYLTLILAGLIAMASKYILAINKKHIFNPAAIATVILGIMGNGNAYWWIGSDVLLPFVAILGMLVVRKIRRFRLVATFIMMSLLTISFVSVFLNHTSILSVLKEAVVSWPLIFFATVMLTEPLTTPPTKKLQMVYGGIVGILFGSQFSFGPIFSTPELALVLGNIFSFVVSPKQVLMLSLQAKNKLAESMHEFVFTTKQQLSYSPGQYLEWTLPHKKADFRGNRRYFTIASSPTENELKLGIKIPYNNASSFKKALLAMNIGEKLSATHLAGDFILPDDKNKKLLFIAGGIGITPFRSMMQYLLDKNEQRDIVLLYSSPHPNELSYKEIFAIAQSQLHIKTIYVISKKEHTPDNWNGLSGRITQSMLSQTVPDFAERIAFLSGPNTMVESYKEMLKQAGVHNKNIITDYFPGF